MMKNAKDPTACDQKKCGGRHASNVRFSVSNAVDAVDSEQRLVADRSARKLKSET